MGRAFAHACAATARWPRLRVSSNWSRACLITRRRWTHGGSSREGRPSICSARAQAGTLASVSMMRRTMVQKMLMRHCDMRLRSSCRCGGWPTEVPLSSTPILSPILIVAMSVPLAAAAGTVVAVLPMLARQAADRYDEHWNGLFGRHASQIAHAGACNCTSDVQKLPELLILF